MLQQVIEGQTTGALVLEKRLAEINSKVDCSYNELRCKYEDLTSKMTYMERQAVSNTSSKHTGPHPREAIQNPKAYAHAVTLRSGWKLLDNQSTEKITKDSEVQEGEDPHQNEVQTNEPTKLDQPSASLDALLDRAKPTFEERKAAVEAKDKEFALPPYKPTMPFPGRFKKELIEKYKALFDRQLMEIELRMPLMDAFKLIPQSHNYLKNLIMERIKEVQGMEVQSQECNLIIHKERVREKLEKLVVEDQLQTSLTKRAEAKYLPSETLISKKSLASHKVVAWTNVIKGVIRSKTEVMTAKEACSTQARPSNSTSRPSSSSTHTKCSSSTSKLDLHVKQNTLASDKI